MSSGVEHYREAEKILAEVSNLEAGNIREMGMLALAAATALGIDQPIADHEEWHLAAATNSAWVERIRADRANGLPL